MRRIDRYEERERFSGWLFTLARRVLIDDRRRAERRSEGAHDRFEESTEADLSPDADPLRTAGREEDRRDVAAAVALLPDPQREVVLLRWYAGLDTSEVAAVLDQPRETVKSRLRYALGHLRSALGAREQLEHE